MQNENRINIMIVEAKSLKDKLEEYTRQGITNPEYYDEYGRNTEAYLIEYDCMVAQLQGLYSRIGELAVAQTHKMQLIDGIWQED